MQESVPEIVSELLGILVYAGGSLLAAALGLRAEYMGIQDVLAGQSVLGLWFVFIGFVALAIATTLTTDKVLPAVQARLDSSQ